MRVRVEFEIKLPDIDNEERLEEFLRFSFGDNGFMDAGNPFTGNHVEPIFGTFDWEIILEH